MDETMVPVDYQSSGQITDDVIFKKVPMSLSVVILYLTSLCVM